MTRRIVGILLLSSPFIGLLLLPLYTSVPWWIVGAAYGLTTGVLLVVVSGLKLLM